MKTIEIGQTIYMGHTTHFNEVKPSLVEFVVTEVHPLSFYARRKDSTQVIRIDRENMMYDGSTRFKEKVFLIKEEYWNLIVLKDEEKALRQKIQASLNNLDIHTLEKIVELIGG